jgi:3-oxoacyl-[acyl-carrier protein] reductase
VVAGLSPLLGTGAASLVSAPVDLGIAGRRAAVAAASAGLGLGSARALAREGVDLAICGRDPDRLAAAVTSLRAEPGADRVEGLVADVGTPDGAAAFLEEAAGVLGVLDIVVANAGGPPPGTFASTDLDAYVPALELNLLSTVAMCRAAVPAMAERGWGRVVAITSSTVRQPAGALILSNTARAGATAFLKTVATEVAPRGVTVNSVQPGLHATDRLRRLYGGDLSAAGADIPAGRVGDPEDFGAAVAFLCSAQAGFITGTTLLVDGGAYPGLA